jgi:SAM-dependent methyltransferase
MGISAVMVHWFARLHKRGVFAGAESVVELCPQDIMTTPDVIRAVFGRLTGGDAAEDLLNDAFADGQPKPFGQRALYRRLGLRDYTSIDMFDARADWRLDLNQPCRLPRRFSVVTNFGSSEHIFNIAQSFRTVHELLEPGGTALFVLPAFGDINHGFWNVHPTVYFDVAEENGYTVEDLVYIDNFGVRCRLAEENANEPFSFRDLPVTVEDCMRPDLARLVSLTFLRNLTDPDTARLGGEFPCFVFDYCFVALRKPASVDGEERVLSFPTQGRYRM